MYVYERDNERKTLARRERLLFDMIQAQVASRHQEIMAQAGLSADFFSTGPVILEASPLRQKPVMPARTPRKPGGKGQRPADKPAGAEATRSVLRGEFS